jgi:predicted transposase/invertase (TIGR01784 family)
LGKVKKFYSSVFFVKTDSLFFTLFARFPETFFELIGEDPQLSQTYHFDSVEVKQLAFRIDGVFLPLDQEHPIHFTEVQFWEEDDFYTRLISEIILYLYKSSLSNDWRATVIFPCHDVEPALPQRYQEFFTSGRIQVIYLDELTDAEESLGVGAVKLVVAEESQAGLKARRLVEQAQVRIEDPNLRREYIEFIETILIYKLPQKSFKEIAAMLGVKDIKQTRAYQEVYQEAHQEGVEKGIEQVAGNLLQMGMSLEQVSQATGLRIDQVQQLQE